MVEWSEWRYDYTEFSTGHLHLAVDSWDGPFRWRVTSGANLTYLGTDSVGVADTLDAAKLAAETFARFWVAAQAAALNPDWGEAVASFEIPSSWISVGERLPERGVAVLAVYVSPIRSDRRIDVMWNGYNGWHAGGAESVTVTHWRPLPPLPVVEVEE